jgi:hypothetical protein
MIRLFTLYLLTNLAVCFGQVATWDTLDIRYRRAEINYGEQEIVMIIKVPPYLNETDLQKQIKLAVQFPGTPPPDKKHVVYVFRDDQPIRKKSDIYAIYKPGKGFDWKLDKWQQDLSIFEYEPSELDKLIYNAVMDSIFSLEISPLTFEQQKLPAMESIAQHFEKTVAAIDSIYFKVMWWRDLQERMRKKSKP